MTSHFQVIVFEFEGFSDVVPLGFQIDAQHVIGDLSGSLRRKWNRNRHSYLVFHHKNNKKTEIVK